MKIAIALNFALALARRARVLQPIRVAAICTLYVLTPLYAQTWTPGSAGSMYYTGGNVGIGTTGPTYPLTAVTSSSYVVASFRGSAFVGVTDAEVHIDSHGSASGYSQLALDDRGTPLWGIYKDSANQFNISHYGMTPALTVPAAGNALYLMPNGGNVGIGTTAPQYLLSVKGTIGAKEVIVTNSGWADYVFDSNYRLMPLKELRAYLEEHHHLPDIPSNAEIRAKGVDLAEIEAKLLAKIEELTLHMIEADERADRIAKQNQNLQAQMRELLKKGPRSSSSTLRRDE